MNNEHHSKCVHCPVVVSNEHCNKCVHCPVSLSNEYHNKCRERSGSVVECLTRDRRAALFKKIFLNTIEAPRGFGELGNIFKEHCCKQSLRLWEIRALFLGIKGVQSTATYGSLMVWIQIRADFVLVLIWV